MHFVTKLFKDAGGQGKVLQSIRWQSGIICIEDDCNCDIEEFTKPRMQASRRSRTSPIYMLNMCGDSTPPSRTPSFSVNGLPMYRPIRKTLRDKSKAARHNLHNPRHMPHSNMRRIRMLRLRDGKAVRRSTKSTYNRRPEEVRECIKVRSTKISLKTANSHAKAELLGASLPQEA